MYPFNSPFHSLLVSVASCHIHHLYSNVNNSNSSAFPIYLCNHEKVNVLESMGDVYSYLTVWWKCQESIIAPKT